MLGFSPEHSLCRWWGRKDHFAQADFWVIVSESCTRLRVHCCPCVALILDAESLGGIKIFRTIFGKLANLVTRTRRFPWKSTAVSSAQDFTDVLFSYGLMSKCPTITRGLSIAHVYAAGAKYSTFWSQVVRP